MKARRASSYPWRYSVLARRGLATSSYELWSLVISSSFSVVGFVRIAVLCLARLLHSEMVPLETRAPVDIVEVRRDLPGREPLRRERQHDLVDPRQPALTLASDRGVDRFGRADLSIFEADRGADRGAKIRPPRRMTTSVRPSEQRECNRVTQDTRLGRSLKAVARVQIPSGLHPLACGFSETAGQIFYSRSPWGIGGRRIGLPGE
jgi:hypothetical protein